MSTTLLRNATAIDERGEVADAWVLVRGDLIEAVGSGQSPDADVTVDLDGAIITPGFIDLHGHGAGGHAYDDGADELTAALAVHRAHGTTRSAPELMAIGQDEESRTLTQAVRWFAEDRVLLDGARTIIFT